MRFLSKLIVFAVVLTVGLAVYKGTSRFRHHARVDEGRQVVVAPSLPELPALPRVASPAEPAAAAAPHEQVRILTTNRAAFLSLRDDRLVAGLSDSIRQMVSVEMKKEMAKEPSSGVGGMIEKVVRSGVEKLLDKEIEVPVSEIKDIDYRRNRIVIVYRRGEPSGVINLETLKGDGDRTLLEQFSEADARRLVEAVKVRIR